MKRHLFCRFEVTWPTEGDRQSIIERIVARQVDRWTDALPAKIRDESGARWLSERVMEVRVAGVTVWVVLTEREVSLFWNAPIAAKLLLRGGMRETILENLKRDVSETLVAPSLRA